MAHTMRRTSRLAITFHANIVIVVRNRTQGIALAGLMGFGNDGKNKHSGDRAGRAVAVAGRL